jgi:hypothetical protein
MVNFRPKDSSYAVESHPLRTLAIVTVITAGLIGAVFHDEIFASFAPKQPNDATKAAVS